MVLHATHGLAGGLCLAFPFMNAPHKATNQACQTLPKNENLQRSSEFMTILQNKWKKDVFLYVAKKAGLSYACIFF